MLVKIYKVDDLFNDIFKKLITSYNYKCIYRYICYKGYLFLCMFSNDEEDTNITISSDMCIFYNGSYKELTKNKLKKILKNKIRKG